MTLTSYYEAPLLVLYSTSYFFGEKDFHPKVFDAFFAASTSIKLAMFVLAKWQKMLFPTMLQSGAKNPRKLRYFSSPQTQTTSLGTVLLLGSQKR